MKKMLSIEAAASVNGKALRNGSVSAGLCTPFGVRGQLPAYDSAIGSIHAGE